jgi:CRP-like cAMP-binding protein
MIHPDSELRSKGRKFGPGNKKGRRGLISARPRFLREGIKFEQDLMKNIKRHYGFFNHFEEEEIRKILRSSERSLFNKGDIIFQEGSPPNRFFIIISGSVRILTKVGDRDEELALLEHGNCFGEMGLIDEGLRSATAVANEESLVFSISEEILRNADPFLCLKVYKNLAVELSRKLRKADDKIKELIIQQREK